MTGVIGDNIFERNDNVFTKEMAFICIGVIVISSIRFVAHQEYMKIKYGKYNNFESDFVEMLLSIAVVILLCLIAGAIF